MNNSPPGDICYVVEYIVTLPQRSFVDVVANSMTVVSGKDGPESSTIRQGACYLVHLSHYNLVVLSGHCGSLGGTSTMSA
jgi:hypothetical protein